MGENNKTSQKTISKSFEKVSNKIEDFLTNCESKLKKLVSVDFLICLLVNFFVIFSSTCCFGGTGRFSIDGYNAKQIGGASEQFVSCLRPFGALVFLIMNAFGHNPIHNTLPDFLIFATSASIIVSVMTFVVYKNVPNLKQSKVKLCLLDMGLLLTVLNTYFADSLSFPECIFIHSLALAMTVTAVLLFTFKDSVKAYILATVLITASTATYQTYIFLFAVLTATLLIATDKITLKKIISFFAVLLVSGISYAVIALLTAKLTAINVNNRASFSLLAVFERLFFVASKQKSYLQGRGTFNDATLLCCFILLFLIWIFALLFSRESKKTKVFHIIGFIFCYSVIWIPNILSTSNGFRSVFSLFAIPLFVIISATALLNEKIIKYTLFAVVTVMLASNIFRFNQIEIDLCKQNALDAEWAKEIIYNIEEYEKTNNAEVKYIAIADDEESVKTLSESARNVPWADVNCINEFSEKEYVKVDMPEAVYEQYFKGKNWDVFVADEQLVFIGDTLYICNY